MVDKMMKYSFILLNEETEGFLKKLQELGVVDVTRSAKPIDDRSSQMLDDVALSKKLIARLEGIEYSKEADKDAIMKASQSAVPQQDIVNAALSALTELSDLETARTTAEKEVKARKPWGEFDKARIDELKTLGYTVRYYIANRKQFSEEWAEHYPLQVISEQGNSIWFVTICPKDTDYSFPIEETVAPEGSWKDAQTEVDDINARIIETKGLLLRYKELIPDIKEAYQHKLTDLDLYLARSSSASAAENKLAILEGFAPAENDSELCRAFDDMGVLYIREEAMEEDNPPIKLKNNRFVKMFESLTGMYGMPDYGEYDPTPVVSIFFLLFFAMCLGDAGYGLVLILVGLAIRKGWLKISMFDGLGSLIATLGAATAVVGGALGTFFGMSIINLVPEGSALKSYYEFVGSDIPTPMGELPFQMLLALGIGIFHICLAMVIKAVGYTRRFGFKENISTWGWLILIVGGLIIALLGVGKLISAEAIKWAVIVIGAVSALAIYIFNTPGRNPLINVGAGLWDTYNMATGILGDVLSYIRLFALGLAGGMLGAAFNDLGLMVLGDGGFNWVFFVLILIIGHVLNLLMSCLGAFVHPLRLNFVEYFKNSGYEGKGKLYKPLRTEVDE
ncbi:MAG: ATPase V [Bacteroidales bacterium]|nr:ATPase V [Bacteroidales bacterium]